MLDKYEMKYDIIASYNQNSESHFFKIREKSRNLMKYAICVCRIRKYPSSFFHSKTFNYLK